MTKEDRKAMDVAAKLQGKVMCLWCFGEGYNYYKRAGRLKKQKKRCPCCKGTRWSDPKKSFIDTYNKYRPEDEND